MVQDFIKHHLTTWFGNNIFVEHFSSMITTVIILVIAFFLYYVLKLVVISILNKIFAKTHILLLQIVAQNNALKLFAHLIVGVFILLSVSFCKNCRDSLGVIIEIKLAIFYIFIIFILMVSKIIWTLNAYYNQRFSFAKDHPIDSYLKVLSLIVWIIGIILMIAYFTNTSASAVLTGIGALSAVILLVFKDVLLGIIASIQAAATGIVKIGDIIAIKSKGVEGKVLDISISHVKVENADSSITNIPTYILTSDVLQNFRPIQNKEGFKIYK